MNDIVEATKQKLPLNFADICIFFIRTIKCTQKSFTKCILFKYNLLYFKLFLCRNIINLIHILFYIPYKI